MPNNEKTRAAKAKADALVKTLKEESQRKKDARKNSITTQPEKEKTKFVEVAKPDQETVDALTATLKTLMHKPATVTNKNGKAVNHRRLGEQVLWDIRKGNVASIEAWEIPEEEVKTEA